MSLRFATIASSSSGNCVYVGTENTNILIDAGLSGKKGRGGSFFSWSYRQRY